MTFMGKKNKHVLFLILFVLTAVSGCNNFNQVQDGSDADFSDKARIVTFHYDYDGALPEKVLDQIKEAEKKSVQTNEKTAFPKMPSLDEAYYFVSLKNLTNGTTLTSDTCDEITINYNERTISLPMASGNRYIVIVELRNLENKTLFSAADEVELTTKQTVYQNKFILQPSNEGEGCAALEIEYGNNSETGSPEIFRVTNLKDASDVTQKFKLDSVSVTDEKCIKRLVTTPDGTTNGNIPAGAYKVEVEWRKTVGFNGSYISVRSFYISEVVNIFANLNTTQWISNDSNGYIDEQKNKIIITSTKVSDFEKSIFYVDSSAPESGTNGTFTKPFKTLKEAVTASENSTAPGMHYIHIKDEYREEIKTNFPLTKNTSIECYKDRVGDGKGKAELIAGEEIFPVFWLYNVDITELELSGLIIDGNKIPANSDGLFVCAQTELSPNLKIILNDCEVKDCIAERTSGAINMTGNLYLNNCWIHDNVSKIDADTFNDEPDYYKGAGIYLNANSSLYVSGKVIVKDNKCVDVDTGFVLLEQSNIYLSSDAAPHVRATLKINGELSQDADIHISGTGAIPTGSEPVNFGEKWKSAYGPVSRFIKSDEGFAVMNKVSGDIFLAVNGGGVDADNLGAEKVIFYVDKEVVCYDNDTTVNVTAKIDSSEIALSDFDAKIYSGGAIAAVISVDSDNKKILIPQKRLVPGLYYLVLNGTYNGRKYSATKMIEAYEGEDDIIALKNPPSQGNYNISTVTSMKKLASWVNGETSNSFSGSTFTLTKDIELPNNFEMIGNALEKEFLGTFDGNGHTITVTGFASGSTGVFGLLGSNEPGAGAIIKNLTIAGNVFVSNQSCFPFGSDCKSNTIIENCKNKCNITYSNTNIFGLTITGFVQSLNGFDSSNKCVIRNCRNEGNISVQGTSNSNDKASGFFKTTNAHTLVYNCSNTGKITGVSNSCGIGYEISGEIFNCYNSGEITGGKNLYGIAYGIYGPISNCYNSGNLTGTGTGTTMYTCAGFFYDKKSSSSMKACWNCGVIKYSSGNSSGNGCVLADFNGESECLFYLDGTGSNGSTSSPICSAISIKPNDPVNNYDFVLQQLNDWVDRNRSEDKPYVNWIQGPKGPYFLLGNE